MVCKVSIELLRVHLARKPFPPRSRADLDVLSGVDRQIPASRYDTVRWFMHFCGRHYLCVPERTSAAWLPTTSAHPVQVIAFSPPRCTH